MPKGLVVTKNTTAKTLTISGTPTEGGTYTVTTEGGTGSAVVVTGIIALKPPIACASLLTASITSLASAGTYRLVLYNAAGTVEVKVLTEGTFATGNTDYQFMATGLTSGTTYMWKLLNGATIVKSGTVLVP